MSRRREIPLTRRRCIYYVKTNFAKVIDILLKRVYNRVAKKAEGVSSASLVTIEACVLGVPTSVGARFVLQRKRAL